MAVMDISVRRYFEWNRAMEKLAATPGGALAIADGRVIEVTMANNPPARWAPDLAMAGARDLDRRTVSILADEI
jgi:hypothetical protein